MIVQNLAVILMSDHWREEGSSVLTGSQIVALRETTVYWTGARLR